MRTECIHLCHGLRNSEHRYCDAKKNHTLSDNEVLYYRIIGYCIVSVLKNSEIHVQLNLLLKSLWKCLISVLPFKDAFIILTVF